MKATRYYLSLVAFVLGIAFASLFTPSQSTLMWLLFGAVGAALLWRLQCDERKVGWLYASLILAFFVCGAWRFIAYESTFGQSVFQTQVGQLVTLTGVVVREPEQRESSLRLYLKSGVDIILVTTDRYRTVAYGDELSVSGVLKEPTSFTTELGRTFNYPEYLKVREVEYVISFAEVSVMARNQGNPALAQILEFKQRFLKSLNEALPEPMSGLAAGVLLGVKQALGEELERAFRETGIIHIVVLSGYNIMLVVSFITFVLGSVLSRQTTAVLSICAIAGFALMVGLSATVLRACLMAGILLLAQVVGRRYLALRALLLVGVIMLYINPYLLLYDIGFQLSFMATLGLILLSPYIERIATIVPSIFSLRQLFAATVSTQITVLPLLLFHIGEASFVGIVVNLLVLPLVPFAMLFSCALGLINLALPLLTPVCAVLAYTALAYIIVVAEFFASLPVAALTISEFTLPALMVSYAGLVILVGYLLNRYPLGREPGEERSHSMSESLVGWTIEEENDSDAVTQGIQKNIGHPK